MPKEALLKPNLHEAYPMVTHGDGVYLFDSAGHRYLDGSSGAMTVSIGHGVAEVAEVMREQAGRVAFTYRTQFTNEPAEELARRLARVAPGDLNHAFFVSSGSEASEFAIRAAVGHWREKGEPHKVKVLGRESSYHGMTMGALSMSGHAARRPDYGSLLHSFPVSPPAYAYRHARAGESDAEYAARSVEEFEASIIAENPDTVAAVIVEPIVGAAGGVLVPPSGYLRLLREACDRQNVLLVLDEVITGAGRTGTWFACAREEVVPDVLLFGKGIGGGYAPLAGVLLRDHMVQIMRQGSGVTPFGHTFSNNPLGAATCLAVWDIIERDRVLENVRRRGVQLEEGLRKLASQYDYIADVRGRGLLWGFEFVLDPGTKRPPAASSYASTVFVKTCFSQGLMLYPAGIAPLNNAVIISPPLTINEAETDELLARLAAAVTRMGAYIEKWRTEAP